MAFETCFSFILLQESAGRLSEVMNEQTVRLQELRRQLTSGFQVSGVGSKSISGPDSSVELQPLQEELCLSLRREKEAQDENRSMSARVDSLTRTLHVKEDIIRVSMRE